jgi:hypothetical protein
VFIESWCGWWRVALAKLEPPCNDMRSVTVFKSIALFVVNTEKGVGTIRATNVDFQGR